MAGKRIERSIYVEYNNRTETVPVDNIVANLQRKFDLNFQPTRLLQKPNYVEVELSDKAADLCNQLVKGRSYVLPNPPERKTVWQRDGDEFKEELKNAATLCQAVYAESEKACLTWLNESLAKHNVRYVAWSKYGAGQFLVAEEHETVNSGILKRVFVVVRGSKNADDWKDNLNFKPLATLMTSNSNIHAGFLERSLEEIPLETILQKYAGKPIIFCGHSMGGAVAAIAFLKACNSDIPVGARSGWKCFTFGAPLWCEKNLPLDVTKHIFNVVNVKDIVPLVLLDEFRQKKVKAFKDSLDLASKVTDFFGFEVPVVSASIKLLKKIVGGIEHFLKWNYAPHGNLLLVGDANELSNREFEADNFVVIMDAFRRIVETQVDVSNIMTSHSIESYIDELERLRYSAPDFSGTEEQQTSLVHEFQALVPSVLQRKVESNTKELCPVVDNNKAEIYKIKGPKEALSGTAKVMASLWLDGRNLHDVLLKKSKFNGLPFGRDSMLKPTRSAAQKDGNKAESLQIKDKFPKGGIVLKQASHLGPQVVLSNAFGDSEKITVNDNSRTLVMEELNLMSDVDMIDLVEIQYQRHVGSLGVAPEIRQKLASEADFDQLATLLCVTNAREEEVPDGTTSANGASNSPSKEKMQEHLDLLEQKKDGIVKALNTPLQLEKKIPVGTIILGVTVGVILTVATIYLAPVVAPAVPILGALEASGAACAGGVAGGGLAAFLAKLIRRSSPSQAKKEMKHITDELKSALPKEKEALKKELKIMEKTEGSVSDVYLEKALAKLYDPEKKKENFKGTNFEDCDEESLDKLVKRCDVYLLLSKIRIKLAKQCIIAVVGVQKAGKGTLLENVWGICQPELNGLRKSTDKPQCFQVDDEILLFDMPGREGLDEVRDKFARFGAIGNLMIMVVDFESKPKKATVNAIADLYVSFARSSISRMLLCVNKCGPLITNRKSKKAAVKELGKEPISILRELYLADLNDALKKFNVEVKNEDLLFTDFMVEDQHLEATQAAGIVGEETVRDKIRKYLEAHGVFSDNPMGQEKLDRLFDKVPKHLNPVK